MFRYYLLGGDTAAPSGLYASLCHAFIVLFFNDCSDPECVDFSITRENKRHEL